MNKGAKYIMPKDKVIEYFGKLPTTKTSHIISRQVNHPLGSWIITKPTRKHRYILEVV